MLLLEKKRTGISSGTVNLSTSGMKPTRAIFSNRVVSLGLMGGNIEKNPDASILFSNTFAVRSGSMKCT